MHTSLAGVSGISRLFSGALDLCSILKDLSRRRRSLEFSIRWRAAGIVSDAGAPTSANAQQLGRAAVYRVASCARCDRVEQWKGIVSLKTKVIEG